MPLSQEQRFKFRLRYEREQEAEKAAEPTVPERTPVDVNPLKIAARESGFLKGITDPAAGISQLAEETGLTDAQALLSPEQQIALKQANIQLPTESESIRREERLYQAEKEKQGEEGFDWDRLLGNIVSPPAAALMAVPGGQATLPARMAAGSGAGVVGAAQQPVTSEGDFSGAKTNQALWGAAGGAVIPAAISGAGKARDVYKEFKAPFSVKGIEDDVAKYFRELAGEEREPIIAALNKAQGDETAQQVLGRIFKESIEEGNPQAIGQRIARFEDELAKSKSTGGAIASAKAAQAKSRLDVMDELSGSQPDVAIPQKAAALQNQATITGRTDDILQPKITDVDEEITRLFPDEAGITDDMITPPTDAVITGTKLNVAKSVKKASADANYNKAWEVPVVPDEELGQILSNPFIKDAIPAARKLAEADGITFESNPTKYLHYIKIGVDEQLQKVGDTALGGTSKKAAQNAQSDLVGWLGNKNPAYEFARAENIRLSKPIDQMNVGQVLKEGLETPATKESPLPFLRAMKDAPKTLKKATGFRHQELGDVLDSPQMSSVDKIKQALLSEQKGKELASGKVGSLPDLRSEIEMSLPNMLSRPVLIANAILKQVGKDKSPEYQKVAEALILQPNQLAKALDLPPENMRKKIAEEILRKASIISSSQEMGRGIGAQ